MADLSRMCFWPVLCPCSGLGKEGQAASEYLQRNPASFSGDGGILSASQAVYVLSVLSLSVYFPYSDDFCRLFIVGGMCGACETAWLLPERAKTFLYLEGTRGFWNFGCISGLYGHPLVFRKTSKSAKNTVTTAPYQRLICRFSDIRPVYMNGLYEIHHMIAYREMLVYFGLAVIATYKREELLNWINLLLYSFFGSGRYHIRRNKLTLIIEMTCCRRDDKIEQINPIKKFLPLISP